MATQRVLSNASTFGTPTGGDSIFVEPGASAVTGNSDWSGVTRIVTMEVAKGFSGSIGTASAPFKAAATTRILHMGSGDFYWESNSSDSETTALAWLWGSGTLYCTGSGAIITRGEAINGRFILDAASTLTTGRFGGSSNFELRDDGSGPTVTTLEVAGGSGVSRRPHTTINGVRGALVLDADTTGAVNTHGTINLYNMALTIRDSGTITLLNALGSIPDLSQLVRALTITDVNINMMLPNAQAFLDHPLITFSNTPVRLYTDGRPL